MVRFDIYPKLPLFMGKLSFFRIFYCRNLYGKLFSVPVNCSLRPFLTARVQDLGFRKITLWGGKYVNFSRTQKLRTQVREKQGHFSRTRVLSFEFWEFSNSKQGGIKGEGTVSRLSPTKKNLTALSLKIQNSELPNPSGTVI